MIISECERCGEPSTQQSSSYTCGKCVSELSNLRRGDTVEWYHHKGSWRSVKFISLDFDRGTALLVTPIGCEIYRKLSQIRLPNGRPNKS